MTMDRKYTIAMASATALVTMLSLYYLSRKKHSKRNTKKETKAKKVEEPVEKKREEPPREDGTFDVSTLSASEDAIRKAIEFTNAKLYKNAILCYTKGIKLIGQTDITRRRLCFMNRAQCYFLLENYPSAMSSFAEAIALTPLESIGYINRGEAYMKMGQEDKALQDLTLASLIESNAKNQPEKLQTMLSQLEASIGNRLAKEELARRAVDGAYTFPTPTKSTCLSRLAFYASEKAADYNSLQLDLMGLTNQIQACIAGTNTSVSLGDLYLMRGGYLKSHQMFVRAAEDFERAANPAHHCSQLFNALLEKATYFCLQGNNQAAAKIFAEMHAMGEKERGENPNLVNFYSKYATCLVSVDLKEAIRIATEMVQLFPELAETHLVHGYVAQTSGNTILAVDELNKSISITPTAYGYITLAACYGQNGLDRGLEMMKKAYELEPTSADVISAYGDLLLFKGQYLNAMNIYEKGMEVCPEDPQAYIAMARLIITVNQKYDEALKYLRMSLERDENNFAAYLAILQIQLMKGEMEGNEEYITKAIRCATGEGSLTEILGIKAVIEMSNKCKKQLEALREKKKKEDEEQKKRK